MELKNLYIVTYVIDGNKEVDGSIFVNKSLAIARKNEIESGFSTDPYFQGATVETHKLVCDGNSGVTNTVWRVDFIRNFKLCSSMFYTSKARAEKKYNEIMNTYPVMDIELEKFYITGKQISSNKIGTLDY